MQEGISVFSPDGRLLGHAPLQGAGALCVCDQSLFCADGGGVIWRFDTESLMPQTVFSGGPGICDLCLSPDGERLYALLGDADSVFLCDARSTQALALNRCGCNPCSLALCGDTLAVAGGESGCVHLFDAATLESRGVIPMPGPVYDVVFCADAICALCLKPQLNTQLVLYWRGLRQSLTLRGMPGCLLAREGRLLAATQGRLFAFACDSVRPLAERAAPGRPSRMCMADGRLILYDPLSERAFSSGAGTAWRLIGSGVRALCPV